MEPRGLKQVYEAEFHLEVLREKKHTFLGFSHLLETTHIPWFMTTSCFLSNMKSIPSPLPSPSIQASVSDSTLPPLSKRPLQLHWSDPGNLTSASFT